MFESPKWLIIWSPYFAAYSLGMLLNSHVIFIISREKKFHNGFGIHTFTICCLSIQFSILGILQKVFQAARVSNEKVLKTWKAFAIIRIICACLLEIALSINRYWAVSRPGEYRKKFSMRNSGLSSLLIIVISIVIVIPIVFIEGCASIDQSNYESNLNILCNKVYYNLCIATAIISIIACTFIDLFAAINMKSYLKMVKSLNLNDRKKRKLEIRFAVQAFLGSIISMVVIVMHFLCRIQHICGATFITLEFVANNLHTLIFITFNFNGKTLKMIVCQIAIRIRSCYYTILNHI